MNSIIAKLASLDEILKGLRLTIKEETKTVTETKTKKDELDTFITETLNKLKHELYDKLNTMLDQLKSHTLNQRGDALKLQQEISILKKEKLDLMNFLESRSSSKVSSRPFTVTSALKKH